MQSLYQTVVERELSTKAKLHIPTLTYGQQLWVKWYILKTIQIIEMENSDVPVGIRKHLKKKKWVNSSVKNKLFMSSERLQLSREALLTK